MMTGTRSFAALSGVALTTVALAGCGASGHSIAPVTQSSHVSEQTSSPSASPSSTAPSSPSSSSPAAAVSTAPQQVAKIAVSASPNPVAVNQKVVISGTVFLADGDGAPDAAMTIMGLPSAPEGDTVHTNQHGQYSVAARWSHPGTYTVSVGNGLAGWQTQVVVDESSSSSATTLAFAGQHVVRYVGTQAPQAIPQGFKSAASQNLTFAPSTYHVVEGFSGTLGGHPFVLDFYQNTQPSSAGLYMGIEYNQHPVYFGDGPAAGFDVLAFKQDSVVLGNMAQGTYMVMNLETGQQNLNAVNSEAGALDGYTKSTPPPRILGLPGTNYPVSIP